MTPWDNFEPRDGVWYGWKLNGAFLYLSRVDDDWFWATQPKTRAELNDDFGGPYEGMAPEGLAINRAVCPRQTVGLRPTTLQRPFVVTAVHPIRLLKGYQIHFVLDLPIALQWTLESGDVLARPNTILLSKTWFGDTTAGTPCFAWPESLRPQDAQNEHPITGSLLRCRVVVSNQSKSAIELKTIAVHTELLGIWHMNGGLRTDIIELEGLGDESLKMTVRTDPSIRDGRQLFEAPMGSTEYMVKRGVSFLRTITGIHQRGPL